MTTLAGRSVLITGASRGIGRAIALRAARDGANVAILGKTETPHPKLPGTIHDAADAMRAVGGKALPIACDVRDDAALADAVARTVDTFGGLDALVCNASAISLTGTLDTPMKRFDLMYQINTRGTYAAAQAALPALLKSASAHILVLAPPLNLAPKWFGPHLAYSLAKYGMSLCVLGLAEEFRGRVAVNALWPRTLIATAALGMVPGVDPRAARTPDIMADAAHAILTRPVGDSGRFFIDEEALAEAGVTDFSPYAADPAVAPLPDLFLDG
jgi:citronellol/citronellal dehydrogenase